MLDASARDFAARACELLRLHGFARVRLSPADAACAQRLLRDAEAFFEDGAAPRRAHIPPRERPARDSRSGYVPEPGREFYETHPRAGGGHAPATASAATLQRSAADFSASLHGLCERVLDELGRGNAALASLLEAERSGDEAGAVGGDEASFSASMLRVHRYTAEADYPPHEDLGLLTLAPRASVAGLEVQLRCGGWAAIEECMNA